MRFFNSLKIIIFQRLIVKNYSMIYFTDKEIDDLLNEDLPYCDITTSLLRLENKPAKIQFTTGDSMVVCCTEEVMKIFGKVGIQTTLFTPSGEHLEKGVKFLEGEGLTKNVHAVLKVTENLLAFASGIATRTKEITDKAHHANREISVATSRNTAPYTRKITIKAIKSGGAAIYRLGLSESIVVYESHYLFLGGIENLEKRIKEQKNLVSGKTIAVEIKKPEDAIKLANAGVDIFQMHDFDINQIKAVKKELVKLKSVSKLALCGNITPENIEDYAVSGADMLITSWPYHGEPATLHVNVVPIFDVY